MKEEVLQLIDSLNGEDARRALQAALRAQGILPSQAALGGSLRKRIQDLPEERLHQEQIRNAVEQFLSDRRAVYRNANIRVNIALFFCIGCVAAATGVGLWAVWYLAVHARLDALKAISSFVSALLGSGCFWLYRHERIALGPIEKEMQKGSDFLKRLAEATG